MADSFKISQERTPGGTLLSLSGELDINARDALSEAVTAAVADGDVAIDLDAVEFLDSEALGALLDGYNTSRERGSLFRVVNPRGVVHRVLTVSGTLELFDS